MNLRDAATRTVNTFAALAVSKSVAYSLTIDPALPSLLLTDEIRVQQVLGNLIGPSTAFIMGARPAPDMQRREGGRERDKERARVGEREKRGGAQAANQTEPLTRP